MKTEEAIVDLAEQLIRTKGYNAFSYKDISSPLKIKNAAIHYHFPAKSDLGVAVIQKTRNSFEISTAEWKNDSPSNQLSNFFNIYTKSKDENMVCFMGSLGPSYDSLPKAMKDELSLAAAEIRNWVTGVLRKGLEKGEFDFEEEISAKSDLIVSSLLASLIMGKVTGENVLTKVIDTLQRSL